ncbi:MAG TPA: metalloregulator ArsR/SmtB family transcription factor [Ferruginibacter sp.]|nr:metalloregulator ArsR/SmtB family transcription factor [Ferruginibacter sp.]
MMVATQSNEQTISSAKPSASTPINIDFHALKKAAMVLRALNHKLRQQLLKLIEEERRITVTEIYVRLRLEQSVASQHLAILRKAGIVNTERDGKFIFYTVNYRRIDEITQFVKDLVG